MNVNNVLTKEYEKMSNWALYENKANSNPIFPPESLAKTVQTTTCLAMSEQRMIQSKSTQCHCRNAVELALLSGNAK
jgi:hypothetical protein